MMSKYLLGYDLGSSSIKVALLNADTGENVITVTQPSIEMEMISLQPGWAEQNPEQWWQYARTATHEALYKSKVQPQDILAIGISYQMHGLVLADKDGKVLRPAIIWCDSRAVSIGDKAFHALGSSYCLESLLNSPGNFTASKLRWVKEHEPATYEMTAAFMLPGDYLAMKMSGVVNTTRSGLSEGIFWDYKESAVSDKLLDHYGIDKSLIPDVVETFSVQSQVSIAAAAELGLKAGTPITYRAGDQPNNAFSLNALDAGEVAATAGTSGVIYGIVDKPSFDPLSRVNTFLHVNHQLNAQRLGILLCVNGTGIMNSWIRKVLQTNQSSLSYESLNMVAQKAPIGSDGLMVLPFGNGAERMLSNKDIGASFHGLNFNRHQASHLVRASQEGIVFALGYGLEIAHAAGLTPGIIRAGQANMFLSELFGRAFANVTRSRVELFNTDGAQGAARGAGMGVGYYKNRSDAFGHLKCIHSYEPDPATSAQYLAVYGEWKIKLEEQIKSKIINI